MSASVKEIIVPSASGTSTSTVGTVTQEYVSTPYGVARIVLPFEPRTDGIVVVQLPWATAYLTEDCVSRLDDYRERLREAERAAAKLASAKKTKAKPAALHTAGGHADPTASPSPPPVADKVQTQFPSFAPLNVPMYRRRQTLAFFVSSFFALFCCIFSLFCIRSSGPLFWLFLAYVCWMLLFQDYHKNGRGFKSERFRTLKWWTWFRDYFPIALHATSPLDPQGRYIFCYHPHGILSLGAFLNFGSEATGFSQKFPGIDLRILTLTSNFRIPFYGLFLSMMGIADASRESCNNCLQRAPGSAILLVLGGAKESLDSHAYSDYLLTLHRKGFVKVALENHADLVPVFSYGEQDPWPQVDNPRGSLLRKFQDSLQQRLGFAIPLVKGRGIFNYSVGLLPHRRPITTMVGAPVVLPKLDKKDITDAVINEYHEKYKQALADLFNKYKATFACGRKLKFVQPNGKLVELPAAATSPRAAAPAAGATGSATTDVSASIAAEATADAAANEDDGSCFSDQNIVERGDDLSDCGEHDHSSSDDEAAAAAGMDAEGATLIKRK